MSVSDVEPQINVLLTPDQHWDMVKSDIEALLHPSFISAYVAIETRAARNLLAEAQHAVDAPRNNPSRSVEAKARAQVAQERLRVRKQEFWRAGGIAVSAAISLAEDLKNALGFMTGDEEVPTHIDDLVVDPEELLLFDHSYVSVDDLVDSARLWVRGPDYLGRVTNNGLGSNSGFTHAIRYWALQRKRGRFDHFALRGQGVPTLDYFFNQTERLHDMLRIAESDWSNRRVTILRDDEGNQKYFLHRDKRVLIIGFKHHNEDEPRIVTFMDGASDDYVERAVNRCIEDKDKAKLDRLVTPATKVFER